MEATERSISAQIMTSVNPAAIIPILEAWSKTFMIFESVRKFSAVIERKTIKITSAKIRPYFENIEEIK